MDARSLRRAALLAAACCSLGASWRSENFFVQAPTEDLAREFCEAAEHCRSDLAVEWLGQELSPWREPCPIRTTVSPELGAGGVSSFAFSDGRPGNWSMVVQGSHERLINSVIPHEVQHLVFATHFGRPLPRWADEGAATSVETELEKNKHERLLLRFLDDGRGIEIDKLLSMKDYPHDFRPLFAEGYSLTRYLAGQSGRRRFVDFLDETMNSEDWTAGVRKHYGFEDLAELESSWRKWVVAGSPELADAPRFAGRKYRKALRKGSSTNSDKAAYE